MMKRISVIGLCCWMALLALPAVAVAAEPRMATVAVDIIRATKEPGPSDPRLEKFRAQLADFSYQSYQLVESRLVTVEEKKSASVSLEKGKKLQVTFSGTEKNGRARLKLAIPEVMESTVALGLDGVVVLGGPALPSSKGGVLFVPVTLINAPKK